MNKATLFAAVLYFSTYIVYGGERDSPCGDNWIAFENEKCFKLVKIYSTHDQAEEVCNQQTLVTDSSVPTLASIKSTAEQQFLLEYVFNSSDSNIWIGAKRRLNSNTEFEWNDGSVIEDFTNWANESPTSDFERSCVRMQWIFSDRRMEWSDVNCSTENWVLCEKIQTWSFKHLQQTILELQSSLKSVTNQLSTQSAQLNEAKVKLEVLQENAIPVGFIYVQLPHEQEPYDIWGFTMFWTEITAQYAGLFFRVLGEDSEPFGVTQAENSPRLTEAQTIWTQHRDRVQILANNEWSDAFSTGAGVDNSAASRFGVRFIVSGGEVRPRNSAIRIWRRIH